MSLGASPAPATDGRQCIRWAIPADHPPSATTNRAALQSRTVAGIMAREGLPASGQVLAHHRDDGPGRAAVFEMPGTTAVAASWA